MEDPEFDTIANRDEAIPVLRIPPPDDLDTDLDSDGETHGANISQAQGSKGISEPVRHDVRSGGLQERLLNSILAQVIPVEPRGDGGGHSVSHGSRVSIERPSFSLPTMSTNFRRFNSRVGVLFVFQNRLIRLFSWRTPTHTLSFLAVYTLICLQPALIPALPFGLILFYVMIPAFLTRHPPPAYPSEGNPRNSSNADSATGIDSAWSTYAYATNATAPPRRVRPAPELSKDFFRNMRDLQNSMEDFSQLHDAAIAHVLPYTDFSDEKLSSALFLVIFALLLLATVAAHMVPWRLVAVVTGWAVTVLGHPRAQEIVSEAQSSKASKQAHSASRSWLDDWIASDIILDEPPEVREVEVFELQHRRNQPIYSSVAPTSHPQTSRTATLQTATSDSMEDHDENWEPWLFSPSPHDPLCQQRLSGAWPAGTQFFEEVSPPPGWSWRDKKWTLDFLSEAWVEERCVTGVEVERQGGRWVYDIAYPDTDFVTLKKGGKKSDKQVSIKSWEEGTGRGQKGEWRRRRWVRLVERKTQKGNGS